MVLLLKKVEAGRSGLFFFEGLIFFNSVFTAVVGLGHLFCFFGVGAASVALVDSLEEVDILYEQPDAVLVLLGEDCVFAVVEHE